MNDDLLPMQNKKAIVIPGRFNPPHLGHAKLVERARLSMPNSDYDHIIIVVIAGKKTAENKNKNPLNADERIYYLRNSTFTHGVTILTAVDAFDAMAQVRKSGYEPIEIVGGFTDDGKENRPEMYKNILDKYFDNDGETINHKATGVERDPVSGDDKAISSTMVKLAVITNSYDEFSDWTSLNTKQLTKQMFNKLRDVLE